MRPDNKHLTFLMEQRMDCFVGMLIELLKTNLVKRLRSLLAKLDASSNPADMDLAGLRFHPLQGNLAGFHAVMVSGNWRLIFRFNASGSAIDVDLMITTRI